MPSDNASARDILLSHGVPLTDEEVAGDEAIVEEPEEGESQETDTEIDNDSDEELDSDVETDEEEEDEAPAIPELGDGAYTDEDRETWEKRWKGVLKRENRLKNNEAELKFLNENKTKIDTYLTLETMLSDPSKYREAFQNIVRAVEDIHKVSAADLLGTESPSTNSEDFEFDDDRKIYEKAKKDALSEFEKKYGSKLKNLQEFEEQSTNLKQEKAIREFLDRSYKGLASKIEKETGFRPTERQALKAIQSNPEIKDAEKAIKFHYLDLIQKQTLQSKTPPKAPPVPKSVLKGSTQVDDGSAASILRKHGLL